MGGLLNALGRVEWCCSTGGLQDLTVKHMVVCCVRSLHKGRGVKRSDSKRWGITHQ